MRRHSTAPAGSPASPAVTAAVLVLVAAAAVAAYLPSLNAPFTLDDIRNITDNPSLWAHRLDPSSLTDAAVQSDRLNPFRPLAYVTFALNYRFGRTDPFGYHLVNLGILLLSVPLAFWLALLLGRNCYPEETARTIALGTSALWALHPLLTNGITYIVQRMTSLGTLFQLAALIFFAKGWSTGKRSWWIFALVTWVLAGTTKETAALLPLVVLLIIWLFPSGRLGPLPRAGWLLLAAVVVSQMGLALFALTTDWHANRPFSLTERVLTEGRVVLRYLGLFLLPLPSRMNLDYDFTLSHSLLSPPVTLLAWLFHLVLVAAAVAVRGRRPLFSCGVLAFYILQLLESTVLPLAIIFEHRTYFPSFFLALALMDLITSLCRALAPAGAVRASLLAVILLGGGWGILTFQRNQVWADPVRLWSDVVAKSPSHARAHINLGVTLMQGGRTDEAVDHLRSAVRLNPDYAEAHNHLGVSLFLLGELPGAEEHLRRALRLSPEYAEAHNNLGNIFFARGDHGEARERYEKALSLRPGYVKAHYNLGTTLALAGELQEAAANYRRLLAIDPGHAEGHYNLGLALVRMGRLEEAGGEFAAALRLRPDWAEARHNLEKVESLLNR